MKLQASPAAAMGLAVGLGLVCAAAVAQTSSEAQPDEELSSLLQDQDPAPVEAALDVIPVAQEQPLAAPAAKVATRSAPALEEIIVTARRVSENLQSVPVAITAISADDMRRERINTGQDLHGRVPSLTISTNGQLRNTESPVIRGQGATGGTGPGVIIYFAEAPLPADPVNANQGGPGKFFDLANLQVLKGSQGTLFGRNTTGGALLLEPQKPQDTFAASLRAEATSLSGRGYEGILNLPVVDETLLLRAGAKYFDREGFTDDVNTGKDYDSRHFWTSRLGLLWRASDNIENYLLGHYASSKDNGTSYVIEGVNSEGFNRAIMTVAGLEPLPGVPYQQQPGCLFFNALAPSNDCGQDIVAEQQARGVRRVTNSADPNEILETGGIVDIFNWSLTDQLTLRNIASYSVFKLHNRWDLDGSRAAIDDLNAPDDVNQTDLATYTEELQLQGEGLDDRLKLVAGGYYEYTEPAGPQEVFVTAMFTQAIRQTYEVRRRSISPYAQGTYDLGGLSDTLEGLKITAGARYNFDWFRSRSSLNGNVPVEDRDTALTYTFGVDYLLDPTLLYAKLSRGYKSGGSATRAVNPDHYTYKPEFVTTYEIGSKSDFSIGDTPARVNLSLYHTDYRNMQRAAGDSYVPEDAPPGTLPKFGGAVLNVGQATIEGVELEATVQPFSGFTLSANYSYTHATHEEFKVLIGTLTPQRDCSGQEIERGEVADYQCTPFQNVPRHQYSITTRYQLPLDPGLGEVEGSLTYSWLDRRYTALSALPSEEPGAWLDSLGLLNGSLRWSHIFGSALDVQLYGTNLTDETYRISNSNVWNLLFVQSSIYGEPRTFGFSLDYRWGAE